MSDASPLERLASLHGIEPAYVDVWRRERLTTDETRCALLAAMGVPAGTDGDIRASLEAAAVRPWLRPVPPVAVVRTGTPWSPRVTLPAGKTGNTIAWKLQLEDGSRRRGEARWSALHETAEQVVSGIGYERRELPAQRDLPLGFHALELHAGTHEPATMQVIVAPARALSLADLGIDRRIWGLMVPLYGLRSGLDWGIGDYDDLGTLAEIMAAKGTGFIGINPVHAGLTALPERHSPYSPSSRRFLNPLHIALPMQAALENGAELERVRTGDLVDYPQMARLKLDALEKLSRHFHGSPDPKPASFEAFRNREGEELEEHASFEALFAHFLARDPACDSWRKWPEAYRKPGSAAVARFAAEHRDRIDFFVYLQWLAHEQLSTAQERAIGAGMPIGLYLDLAVGVDPDGADAWSQQAVMADDVRLGAPPDAFNPDGQNWGLVPYAPHALHAAAYRPFADALRTVMRPAGAIRIDHVMGLQRSFWCPPDPDVPGAYVRYPRADLLGLIALESHRQRCMVVGEDLGTVPEGLRAELSAAGLLGCRVLYFEREPDGVFRASADYPASCIASVGTHDLPTLAGFWSGRDIDWRVRLGLDADPDPDSARQERHETRVALLRLLASEGLLPPGMDPEKPPEELPWSIVEAVHAFLARSPAGLMAVQIEDALGVVEQPNLPGTVDAHPNWQRRLPATLENIAADPRLDALARLLGAARQANRVSPPAASGGTARC